LLKHTAANATSAASSTRFQRILGAEVGIFYKRDLTWRVPCGIMPFQGHGAAIRRSSWEAVGGFPLVVSEDYAFTLRALAWGGRGAYAEHIRSWESYPRDFGSFAIRLCKFAGGTAELFRREIPRFLAGSASGVEKADLLFLLLWYPLAPLMLANAFVSAYICHRIWIYNIPFLHPALPYLFLAMFLFNFPVIVSTVRRPFEAIRYWAWAVCVYGAALPSAALHFVVGLFRRPRFARTPKQGDEVRPAAITSLCMVVFGASSLWLSLYWKSPFSFVLASQGVTYTFFPFLPALNSRSLAGWLMRRLVWLPGLLLAIALYAMWHSGKF
jgi:cellulose synthase/poly-beta-1,6-N-acetylglucosamine synthase-like glycosyltransferase